MSLQVEPIKDSTKLEIRQSKSLHLPRLPMRALFLANSSGGKTTLIANLLFNKRAYRDVFSAIYVFSPSVHHDGTWGAVKKYVRDELHKKEEEHFFDEWDAKKVQEIVDTAFAVTKYHKDNGHKKGHAILIIVDDFADRPDILHAAGGSILNSLAIRGRHANISFWVASQRPTLLSTVLRTQATSLFVFRQRSVRDLLSFLDEYSALVDKKTLETMYNYATSKPYGFMMVDLMRPVEQMFHANLDKRMIPQAAE